MQELSCQIERNDLAQWRKDLAFFFGRTQDLAAPGHTRFHGVAHSERFGDITLTQMFTETPIKIRRAVSRSSRTALYHVLFITQGEMRDTNGQIISARNMMIVNNDHPYHVSQSGQFRSLVVTIPAALFRNRLIDIDLRCGKSISSTHGPQRLLQDYVTSLMAEAPYLQPSLRQQTEAHLLDLLCAAAPGPELPSPERQCPRQYISVHLADAAMSPSTVAHALGVSVRTIHVRMAKLGTSFSRELREQRLQKCRMDFLQTGTNDTITDIAARWGFNDPSSFSRHFRARFGISPRDCRKYRSTD